MKRKPKTNTYDPSIPASPENPRPVSREMIFAFERAYHPFLKGIGRTMIELGLWLIPEPLSPQDLTYPDPMHEDMVHPFKIRRSVLNQLIEHNPVYKDLEEQYVANQIWEIVEDQDDAPDSDE